MKKPKIRFKGYQEDWEQRKLGDVFEQTANFVNPNDDDIELWSLTVEDGLTPKSERYNREFLVKKKTNFKEVRPGDIVYNPMNMTLGAVGFNGMAKSVAVSGYYTTMVANKGYDSYYINTWLKSPQAISLYKTFATGSLKEKQRVQFPTLSIIPATFPEHDEQTKIGSYFEHLDNLITLHQRKCEETKTLKKYMLQKMFPQNGHSVPEIRFSGFTEDWEQRKLGELAEIVGGGTPSTSVDSYWDGDIDWYAPAEIGEQIYLKSSQRKITEEGLNKSSAKILPVGTVLFTSRAGIGKTAILLKEGCTNQGFQSIVPNKDKLDSYFIFTRSEELKRYGETVGAGSTFVEVSGKQMVSMELMMPTTMDEQQKIGEYFSNLDHLITLHQHKCEELQNIKKFMLKNMFI
jgi:type I restriction enzyme S subunit